MDDVVKLTTKLNVLQEEIRGCEKCGLRKKCNQVVAGRGTISPLFIVGEWSDSEDDLMGEPFSNRAGQFFFKLMVQAGLNPDDTYFTNMVKCKYRDQNSNASLDAIAACKGWLWKELELQQPKVVVTLGTVVTSLLLKKVKLKNVIGESQKVSYINAAIFPWYSHTYLLQRGKAWDEKTIELLKRIKEYL